MTNHKGESLLAIFHCLLPRDTGIKGASPSYLKPHKDMSMVFLLAASFCLCLSVCVWSPSNKTIIQNWECNFKVKITCKCVGIFYVMGQFGEFLQGILRLDTSETVMIRGVLEMESSLLSVLEHLSCAYIYVCIGKKGGQIVSYYLRMLPKFFLSKFCLAFGILAYLILFAKWKRCVKNLPLFHFFVSEYLYRTLYAAFLSVIFSHPLNIIILLVCIIFVCFAIKSQMS